MSIIYNATCKENYFTGGVLIIMGSDYNDSSLSRMIEYALLYDFYGALLKDKNRAVFEDYMFNDMSLSEISQNFGITRQGVRDIIERSKIRLAGYEERLGLARRFQNVSTSAKAVKDDVGSIRESIVKAGDSYNLDDSFIYSIEKYLRDIEKKTDSILEEF